MDEERRKHVELGDNGVAFIVYGDGRGELILPVKPSTESVPAYVLAVTAVFIRLQDEEAFFKEQVQWMVNNPQRLQAIKEAEPLQEAEKPSEDPLGSRLH